MSTTTLTKSKAAATGTLELVPFKDIVLGTNVRTNLTDIDDLAESIAQYGLQSPLKLSVDHELLAGYRRHAAIAKLISEKRWTGPVPVLVAPGSDARSEAIMHLIENLQRVDLDPVDEAFGFQQLAVTHGMTADEIGAHVRRSTQHVKERISLCVLPEEILVGVRKGFITIAAANKAAKLDVVNQGKLAKKVAAANGHMSDYVVEDLLSNQKKKLREAPIKEALKNAGFKIETYVTKTSSLNTLAVSGIKELKEALSKLPLSRENKLATMNTYSEPIAITLHWAMTPAEMAKAEAKRDKQDEKAQKEREERAARQEAEAAQQRDTLPDDVREWFEQVRTIRATWAAESGAKRIERGNARMSIVAGLPTKDVAAMALRQLAMEFASGLAWMTRQDPHNADAYVKAIGITEKDIVVDENSVPDWRATVAGKASFISAAAGFELDRSRREAMRSRVDEELAKLGLADPLEVYPQPPAHLNPDRGDEPVTWEEANAIVEALLNGEVAVSDAEYDETESYDDE